MMDRFIRWLATSKSLTPLRGLVISLIIRAINSRNGVITRRAAADKLQVMLLVEQIRNETRMQQTNGEALQIFTGVKATTRLSGDIAEVGVYGGASAKMICEAKGNRSLHLFDTFEGPPDPGEMDENYPVHLVDKERPTLERVRDYLKAYPNVYFYKGLFSATASATEDKKFSFVHLDVDLYKSTLDCLVYFYPRMSQGGIIVCHDYTGFTGVAEAVDRFFRDRPETVIELSGNQCLIVKL